MHEHLITCDVCQHDTPNSEGDVRTAFDAEFELCESCTREWDEYGIPAQIAADHLG